MIHRSRPSPTPDELARRYELAEKQTSEAVKHDTKGIRTDELTPDQLRQMREDLLRVYCNLGSLVWLYGTDHSGGKRRTRDDAMATIGRWVFGQALAPDVSGLKWHEALPDIPVRVHNALKANLGTGWRDSTLEDVVNISAHTMSGWRNFGRRSLAELEVGLAVYGITLRQ